MEFIFYIFTFFINVKSPHDEIPVLQSSAELFVKQLQHRQDQSALSTPHCSTHF